jgi:hypothetical protein
MMKLIHIFGYISVHFLVEFWKAYICHVNWQVLLQLSMLILAAEPNGLAIKFLIEVMKKSGRLSTGETLVIVLVGHGEDDRLFTVGGDGRQNCKIHKEVYLEVHCTVHHHH